MRRCKRLRRLREMFNRRISRLDQRIRFVSASGANKDRDLVVSYATIEVLNAWNLFSRSFYLSCALGAQTERKRLITILITSDPLGSAITHIKSNARPNTFGVWNRRDEPAWHDPTVLMSVCQNLGCSNYCQIAQAFSLNLNVFKDLPVFRNFFAHRNEQTLRAAKNIAPRYMLQTYLSPTEILLSVSPRKTESVILEWFAEMLITADFLCKS